MQKPMPEPHRSYWEIKCRCRTWIVYEPCEFYCDKCKTIVVLEWPQWKPRPEPKKAAASV